MFHDIDWCFAESSYTFLDTQSYFHMATNTIFLLFLRKWQHWQQKPSKWNVSGRRFSPCLALSGRCGMSFPTFQIKKIKIDNRKFFFEKVVKVLPLLPLPAPDGQNWCQLHGSDMVLPATSKKQQEYCKRLV